VRVQQELEQTSGQLRELRAQLQRLGQDNEALRRLNGQARAPNPKSVAVC
jgi:hypothetical protein